MFKSIKTVLSGIGGIFLGFCAFYRKHRFLTNIHEIPARVLRKVQRLCNTTLGIKINLFELQKRRSTYSYP